MPVHYWQIHKHVFNEELERLSPEVRRIVQLQDGQPDVFDTREHETFTNRVNRRVDDIYNDPTHPYNQKFTFEATTVAKRFNYE